MLWDGVTSMKRYLLAALLVLIPIASADAADIPDEQRRIVAWGENNGPATQGELFDDLDSWSFIPSQIQIPSNELSNNGLQSGLNCKSVEDPACSKYLALHVKAYLPTCEDLTTLYCIEDFWAIKDGQRIQGVFKSPYPVEKTFGQFSAEPKYELPAGGAGGLWQLPGLTHDGGGDFYWINAQLLGGLNRASTATLFEKYQPNQLWSSISAVSEVSAPGSVAPAASPNGGSFTDTRPLTSSGAQCLVAGVDKCLLPWPLNQNITYGMKVRMAHPITGWLHGRLNSPEFSASTSKGGLFHLTLQGNPVTVPTVFAITNWSESTATMKDRFGGKPSGCCGSGDHWYETAGRNQSSEEMVSDLKMWLPYIKDTAQATPTYWIVRTISNGQIANKQECLVNGAVNGVVTTNATAYTSGAPIFNKAAGSLDYQVASPHFDPAGKANFGNYNLQINSKVARCLYGFTNAPISATVSVISADGTNQVATSTLREKNGWIFLQAAGFTYSAPTVRITFSQKTTITCIKGKVSKKVTGSKPSCPAGYKKR
jgi:hypothetical protein